MVRWRCVVVLAVLLLMPERIGSKGDEEDNDDERRSDDADEDDEDSNDSGNDDDDDDDGTPSKEERTKERDDKPKEDRVVTVSRRPPIVPTSKSVTATRTVKKRPLECYVCAYKAETPLRACLDPTKYRVHTITCHNIDDKCFTSVISKGSSYEAVVRGCRSGCVGSPETTCCELNRCNNQAFAMPVIAPRSLKEANKANKSIPPTVLFFVSVLLVLQTVVKVAFV